MTLSCLFICKCLQAYAYDPTHPGVRQCALADAARIVKQGPPPPPPGTPAQCRVNNRFAVLHGDHLSTSTLKAIIDMTSSGFALVKLDFINHGAMEGGSKRASPAASYQIRLNC